jgi:hypothetical protein
MSKKHCSGIEEMNNRSKVGSDRERMDVWMNGQAMMGLPDNFEIFVSSST